MSTSSRWIDRLPVAALRFVGFALVLVADPRRAGVALGLVADPRRAGVAWGLAADARRAGVALVLAADALVLFSGFRASLRRTAIRCIHAHDVRIRHGARRIPHDRRRS